MSRLRGSLWYSGATWKFTLYKGDCDVSQEFQMRQPRIACGAIRSPSCYPCNVQHVLQTIANTTSFHELLVCIKIEKNHELHPSPYCIVQSDMWLSYIQGRSLDSSFALVFGKMSVLVTGDVINSAIIVLFSYIYCLITFVIKTTSPTISLFLLSNSLCFL